MNKTKSSFFMILLIFLVVFSLYQAWQHPVPVSFPTPSRSPLLVLHSTPAPVVTPSPNAKVWEPSPADALSCLTSFIENEETEENLRQQAEKLLLEEIKNQRLQEKVENLLSRFKGFENTLCSVENGQIFLFLSQKSGEKAFQDQCQKLLDLICAQTGLPRRHIYFIEAL